MSKQWIWMAFCAMCVACTSKGEKSQPVRHVNPSKPQERTAAAPTRNESPAAPHGNPMEVQGRWVLVTEGRAQLPPSFPVTPLNVPSDHRVYSVVWDFSPSAGEIKTWFGYDTQRQTYELPKRGHYEFKATHPVKFYGQAAAAWAIACYRLEPSHATVIPEPPTIEVTPDEASAWRTAYREQRLATNAQQENGYSSSSRREPRPKLTGIVAECTVCHKQFKRWISNERCSNCRGKIALTPEGSRMNPYGGGYYPE